MDAENEAATVRVCRGGRGVIEQWSGDASASPTDLLGRQAADVPGMVVWSTWLAMSEKWVVKSEC